MLIKLWARISTAFGRVRGSASLPHLVESEVPHLYRIWSSLRFRIPTTLGRVCNSASLPYLDFYFYKIVDPQWLRFWSSLRFRIPSAFSRALQWGVLLGPSWTIYTSLQQTKQGQKNKFLCKNNHFEPMFINTII